MKKLFPRENIFRWFDPKNQEISALHFQNNTGKATILFPTHCRSGDPATCFKKSISEGKSPAIQQAILQNEY